MSAFLLRVHHGAPGNEVLLRRQLLMLLLMLLLRRGHSRGETGAGVVVLHHVLVVVVLVRVHLHLHLRRRCLLHGWGHLEARRGPPLLVGVEEGGGQGRHGHQGRRGRGHSAHHACLTASGCSSLNPELPGPSLAQALLSSVPPLESVTLVARGLAVAVGASVSSVLRAGQLVVVRDEMKTKYANQESLNC